MNRPLFVVILAAGLSALLLIAGAARTLAADTSIDCQIPLDAECTIRDADGIAAVRVTVPTAQGPVPVVDETYACAGTTTTSVSWDPIVPNFSMEIEDCTGQATTAAGFGDLLHQPLGDGELLLGENSLLITGFDASGDHGGWVDVTSFYPPVHTPGASQWEARLLPAAPPAEGEFNAAVFAGDLLAPESSIQFSTHFTDVVLLIPTFTAANYEVLLYNGDDLLHRQDGIPSGGQHIWVPEWFCAAFAEFLDCAPRLRFGVDPATGLAYWELTLPEPIDVASPTDRFEADRILFREDGGGGSLPRNVSRVELTGRNLPYLALFGEDTRAPLPPHSLALPVIQGGARTDPFDLDALTRFLEAPDPPADELQISDSLTVRVVGPGNLIAGPVLEDEQESGDGEGGARDPVEPPSGIPAGSHTLRMFNTANKLEYEIVVEGELLQAIHRLRSLGGFTGAYPGSSGAGVDALPGWRPPRTPLTLAPDGWSNNDDNRTLLTNTTWWPWRTIVHFSNNCSGALIGPRHILTAAHCINQRGTNNWYSFTVSPGRNGNVKPFGDSAMNPNPSPGDPFRWYFTPSQWRSAQYNNANCGTSCWAASEWDWGIIIIPEHLGYQTGWMGYVARPASQLNPQSHFNRGYPWCGTGNDNQPDGEFCVENSLYGDTNTCTLGSYLFPGPDNWNRVIRNSCDISGGHSGSPIYHYFYDWQLGKTVPVASMVVIWEHCYTCPGGDTTPNSARRLTPTDLGVISFFRQWKP